ncbi:NAD(P)-binding protein [Meredithblackwellia eburnea MCA 4105]
MATIGTFFYEQAFGKMHLPTSSLQGRTVVISGANRGLGLHSAIHIARLDPTRLILAVRDLKAGEVASEQILAETGYRGVLEVIPLDLARFESVIEFGKWCESQDRIDVALLNAGLATKNWSTTEDGWETTTYSLQVNGLATGLLALLLLPKVAATPEIKDSSVKPHITIVGSEVHVFAAFKEKSVEGSTLAALNTKEISDMWDRYNVTKVLSLFMARQLAQLPLAAEKDVVVNCVNPGLCESDFRKDILPVFGQWIMNKLSRATSEGAKNLVWAAVEDTPPGAYVSCCRASPEAKWTTIESGRALERKLWDEMTAEWVKLAPEVKSTLGL